MAAKQHEQTNELTTKKIAQNTDIDVCPDRNDKLPQHTHTCYRSQTGQDWCNANTTSRRQLWHTAAKISAANVIVTLM